MSKRCIDVYTSVQEVYMKLPNLNYTNEIVFSESVPDISIRKLLSKFNRNRIVLEAIKVGNRTMIIKKSDVKLNTYML